MDPLLDKIITVAVIGWVLWQVIAGRTLIWANRDHPNVFLLNTRWIFRDDEPIFYWIVWCAHAVLVLIMANIAFVQ